MDKQIKKARIMLGVNVLALILIISSFFVSKFWGLAGRYLTLSIGTFLVMGSFIVDIKENRSITKTVIAILLGLFGIATFAVGVIELVK